jgi:hypothetical protein
MKMSRNSFPNKDEGRGKCLRPHVPTKIAGKMKMSLNSCPNKDEGGASVSGLMFHQDRGEDEDVS